jgi:hypothetical protein
VISACDQRGLNSSAGSSHDAMNDQSPIPCKNNYVSRKNLRNTNSLHVYKVAWMDRGRHATADYTQEHSTKSIRHFRCQIASKVVNVFHEIRLHERSGAYETFRFVLQLSDVALILPHDNADTSNTLSNLNSGFR